MENLITLKQPPIIDYKNMIEEAKDVQNRLAKYDFENLVITDENVKEMKQFRASLKKEFNTYEDLRKKLKEAVNKPYVEFENIYNKEFKTVYVDADNKLKVAIDEIEDKQRDEKQQTIIDYFNSKEKPEWFGFERLGIRVGLSDSVKSLKEKVDAALNQINDDLALINTQPHAERILIEYQRTLNVSQSITRVLDDIKREEQFKAQHEAQKDAVKETPQEAEIEPSQEETEALQAPVEEVKEQLITLTFKVTGTRDQLIEVREFMKKVGVKYE